MKKQFKSLTTLATDTLLALANMPRKERREIDLHHKHVELSREDSQGVLHVTEALYLARIQNLDDTEDHMVIDSHGHTCMLACSIWTITAILS